MYTRITGLTLVALSAYALTAHAEPLPSYRLTQIGPVPVNGVGITYVYDLNEKGEMTGAVQTPEALEVVIWRDGETVVIGENGGNPVSINERSVVATTLFDSQSGLFAGFRWRRGVLDALGSPDSLHAFFPHEINNSGQILGNVFDDASFTSQTYLRRQDGTFELLQTWPGARSMFPMDLNNRGVAIGFGESLVESSIAVDCVIWRNGTVERLDTGPIRYCVPGDINEQNKVVGYAIVEGILRGFIWQDGSVEALPLIDSGDLGNSGSALNNRGWVVGSTYNSQAEEMATLWRRGVAHDLNTLIATDDPLKPYVTLYAAYLINDRGWIVALGLDSRRDGTGGGSSPYLLKPANQR